MEKLWKKIGKKHSIKTFPRLPVPYALKSGPLKLDTSHLQLIATASGPNPSQNQTSEIWFKNLSSGSKIKKAFKDKSSSGSWRF